ncbi:MAG TPA: hypothetical protein VFY28_00075 [Candidatus Paceibacterota bacterium]|nr:hypothetical protein [Candidatus Paceibacterota bacterium]
MLLILAGVTALWWVPQVEYEMLSPWTMVRIIGVIIAVAALILVSYAWRLKSASYGSLAVILLATLYSSVSIINPGFWYRQENELSVVLLIATFVLTGVAILIRHDETRSVTLYLVPEDE